MSAPAQQPTWPPPAGSRVTATGTCCGQTLAEVRFTSTGDPEQHIVVPGCPNSVRLPHKPRLTFDWSEPMADRPAACSSCEDIDPASCLICRNTRQPEAPAQPEQPLRQRIAEALAARVNGRASDGHGWFFNEDDRQLYLADADAVLATVQPDLDARDAEIQRLCAELAAVDDELTAQHEHNDRICSAVAERDRLRAHLAAPRPTT